MTIEFDHRPRDADRVLSAIRLGWAVAEVRGRNRPCGPKGIPVTLPPRVDDPLPLRVQRSPTELRIEAQTTLIHLARKLRVDTRPGHPNFGEAIDRGALALEQVRAADPATATDQNATDQNATDQNATDQKEAWAALASLLWHFDAHVQDSLSAISDTQACGYQLGRGLAECYWALDPEAPTGWDSWAFLFNELRCAELTRLAGRLSDYLQEFAASAIAGSLEVWKLLAADTEWHRQPTVEADLYQQTRNWYELVVLHQDPTQLVKPYQVIRSWRVVLKAARAYFPQLLLSAMGVGLLLGFVKAASQKHPLGWVEALLSLFSAAGLSAAGLTAKLKNEAQALSTRLRQDAYTDLIAASITTVPNPPSKRHAPSRQTIVETAVRNRDLTPSTPLG